MTDEIAVILLLELRFTAYSKIVPKGLDYFGNFMVGVIPVNAKNFYVFYPKKSGPLTVEKRTSETRISGIR
jgi:hypothetical protein